MSEDVDMAFFYTSIKFARGMNMTLFRFFFMQYPKPFKKISKIEGKPFWFRMKNVDTLCTLKSIYQEISKNSPLNYVNERNSLC